MKKYIKNIYTYINIYMYILKSDCFAIVCSLMLIFI